MNPVLCDTCGTRPSTRILTEMIDGEKKLLYRCETCLDASGGGPNEQLERPCDQCGKQEGLIKVTRLQVRYRTVTYACERCAGQR